VIDVDSDRDLFARHGLHMNVRGKEKIGRKILELLKDMDKEEESKSIIISWKEEQVKGKVKVHTQQINSNVVENEISVLREKIK
jgi:hypothetical protein